MLIVPPFISNIEGGSGSYSKPIYKFYSIICHQYESRSMHIFVYKIAVCARCTGIYLGFFFGCVLLPIIPIKKLPRSITAWCIISIPMVADVLLDTLGIHSSTIITRVITGLFFGVGSGLILTPILLSSISEFISTKTFIKGVIHESKT